MRRLGIRQSPGRLPVASDVAALAGVSTATVSRVLSGGAAVRPDKREAVLQAAAQLGFVANGAAWLLQRPSDPILVDTGGPGSRAQAPQHYHPGDLLPLELARHGVNPLAVQTIVLIHLHNDHVGGARRNFAAWPILICGTALLVAAQSYATNGLATNMALLTLAGAMLYGSQPVLWSIPGDIVPRRLAGAVSGIINGVGVLGAFAGPFVVGYVRARSNSFAMGLGVLGACLVLAGILVALIREAGPGHSGAVLDGTPASGPRPVDTAA